MGERRSEYPLIVGLGFILLGLLFLLRNFDIITFGRHWWALFFLIPITFLLSEVLHQRKRSQGKFPPEARGSLIGLVTLLTLMVIFLFGLNWGVVWPVFIIIGGLSVLLTR